MKEKNMDINNTTYQKPKRYFEKIGTVNPISSYYVPLDNVVNSENQDIKTLIDMGRYFSIFAPRQSGKTTFLEMLRQELHQDKTYVVVFLSFQYYASFSKRKFYTEIERNLFPQLISRLKDIGCEKAETVFQFLKSHHLKDHISLMILFEELNRILQFKKIVVVIDEFDGIPLKELGNFLTSLRELYLKYKITGQKALYSVGLIGIRNITKLVVGGVSPFNIADHVELPPFSLKNVQDLFGQYTAETNQPFTTGAIHKIFAETSGQPWLVNRLGLILTVNMKPGTIDPISENDVEQAIQLLLQEKNDHFDNLYEKTVLYKETFVEIVFDHVEYQPYDKEQSWLEQYGLIKNFHGHAVVANNIYKAINLKAFIKEAELPQDLAPQEYAIADDRLDMEGILLHFNDYITKIGVRAFYQEYKPHEKVGQFLLTAWLYQFVCRGEGELHYEIVTGLGRMDILLSYKGKKYIIETKVNRYVDISTTRDEGILQITRKYLATAGLNEGYLVIFDIRKPVGTPCKPEYHLDGDKKVTSFTICIGRPE